MKFPITEKFIDFMKLEKIKTSLNSPKTHKAVLLGLILLKSLVVLVSAALPLSGTHTFRQTDTLGVTLRYWLRWTQEAELHWPLFPAVLNPGDQYGITPTEFPIINIFFAPLFSLGIEPGRLLVTVLFSSACLYLLYLNHKHWRTESVLGIQIKSSALLLLIFGCAQMYFDKYIPDIMAFLLFNLACALSWSKNRWKSSLLLATLALLIKPTVITAAGILLFQTPKNILRHCLRWILPAFILTLIYYTFGTSLIRQASDIAPLFNYEIRHPLESLTMMWSDRAELPKFLSKSIFTVYIIYPMILFALLQAKSRQYTQLFLFSVIALQILPVFLLSGDLTFDHQYYFIGTSMVVCVAFRHFLDKAPRVLATLAVLALTIHTIEQGIHTLRPLTREHLWSECRQLRTFLPRDTVYVNMKNEIPPTLALCMGVIQTETKSSWMITYRNQKQENDHLLVAETKSLKLFKLNESD